ncbi:MAG TPA: hypothetical protein VJU18_00020 [Vicinamibacteria bacterium]|nr:hypothetical protein [Vicinamibacteria bacterium]
MPLRSSRTVFSHLQHGRYSVEVEFPDGRVLEALDVAVGERPATAQFRERSDPDE